MSNLNIEQVFTKIDEATKAVEYHKNEPYLDSLSIVLEWLLFKESNGEEDEILVRKLKTSLKEIHIDKLPKDQLKKVTELLILKGMKDSVQAQHLLTPETIALFISYLVNKLFSKGPIRVFDPVCGTANLLTTVLKELNTSYEAFGSEIDPTLLRLAVNHANLLEMEIEFFHQDSLRPFLLDPVDLVIADLPVGYYPDDMIAQNYELRANEGHSYAHHLLIEQSLNYTKDGGYLIFLIPEFLFDSDQAQQLNRFLHKSAHIVGVLRLPEDAFRSEKQVKSIFILQKKGVETKAPHQPLLVMLPSLNNSKAMENILVQINDWFEKYKENSKGIGE